MDMPQTAAAVLVAWLLLGEPLFGRHSHRRMLAELDAGQVRARLRFYRQWTWQAWLLAGITTAVVLANGWTLEQLGLRLPERTGGLEQGFIGGLVGMLVAGLALGAGLARRRRTAPARRPAAAPRVAGGDKVLRMLPRTGAERWGFAALAVTAGLTEEWIWRGFGAAALHAAWPQAPLVASVPILALAFGWAHVYQGLSGVLATAVLGALLAWLYLRTGSLLLPMLLHVLIDLRALLVPAGAGAVAGAYHETDVQTSIQDRGNP
jgi:membrane protease YdiL (CAAX protease family)